jgi:hypothetical protein
MEGIVVQCLMRKADGSYRTESLRLPVLPQVGHLVKFGDFSGEVKRIDWIIGPVLSNGVNACTIWIRVEEQ